MNALKVYISKIFKESFYKKLKKTDKLFVSFFNIP